MLVTPRRVLLGAFSLSLPLLHHCSRSTRTVVDSAKITLVPSGTAELQSIPVEIPGLVNMTLVFAGDSVPAGTSVKVETIVPPPVIADLLSSPPSPPFS